jgi:hypothetical protein
MKAAEACVRTIVDKSCKLVPAGRCVGDGAGPQPVQADRLRERGSETGLARLLAT